MLVKIPAWKIAALSWACKLIGVCTTKIEIERPAKYISNRQITNENDHVKIIIISAPNERH